MSKSIQNDKEKVLALGGIRTCDLQDTKVRPEELRPLELSSVTHSKNVKYDQTNMSQIWFEL